ncbi:hypothetical protein LzC2_40950 [Planctomycetes bacterium LzC2]|uniref:Uncharacterized protein n=2 Tax=Alienimonas chondri TaxID=2681879 RepID=A0ABX1VIN2_9PLAN|nr:hypothetical protein [Alienimonas chondri]
MSNPGTTLSPPSEKWSDKARAIVESAISEVPGGSFGVAVMQAIYAPALRRQTEAFLEEVASRLNDMDKAGGFDLEQLSSDPEFAALVVQATRTAQATTNQEKLGALREALVSTAVGEGHNDNQRAMFMSYIDRLTGLHIRVLRFLHNPLDAVLEATASRNPSNSVRQHLKKHFSEVKQDLIDQTLEDLHSMGLSEFRSEHKELYITADNTSLTKRTTQQGADFVKFITSAAKSSPSGARQSTGDGA